MKVFISADIEGVTGIAHWDEARKREPDYQEFREQMTREVAAACRGALAAGADEIVVKDAHGSGRNLVHRELPRPTRLVRGWSGGPMCMVQELDPTFDVVLLIGYHSAAGSGGNPLAHTLSGRLAAATLNGVVTSEYLIHAYAAATHGVPVVFVSGDRELCEHVQGIQPATRCLAVGGGVGESTVALHPEETVEALEGAVRQVLSQGGADCLLPLPDHFTLELEYKHFGDAYRAAQYPGMEGLSPTKVRFETEDYMEVLRALLFVT